MHEAVASAFEVTGGDRSQLLPLKIAADQLIAANVAPELIAERIRELASEGYQLPDIAAGLKTLRPRRKARPKRTTPETITIAGRILLVGLIVCLVGVAIATRGDHTGPVVTHKATTAKSERTKRIESQFSKWDGAHKNLQTKIQRSLRDPDSYEHIATTYRDTGDALVIDTRYRAKNGFGGMNTGHVVARVDLDGQVLEILSQTENL